MSAGRSKDSRMSALSKGAQRAAKGVLGEMSPRVDTATASSGAPPSPSSSSVSELVDCVVKAQTCSVDSVFTERDQERRIP